jgi:DNA-directed RNA polymerase subunit alpha
MSGTRLNISLNQYAIGLSGAVPGQSSWSEPAMDRAILEFVALLSGIVFKYGGRIVHGSHPTFTPVILRQARLHAGAGQEKPVVLIMSELWAKALPDDYRAGISDVADFITTPQVGGGGPDNPDTRNDSLSLMRKSLIEVQNVMVAVGGKMHSSDGIRPGVGEEMDLAATKGIPRFLIAGMGGFAAEYARELTPASLNNGLTHEQNMLLFNTSDVSACVNLIFEKLCGFEPGSVRDRTSRIRAIQPKRNQKHIRLGRFETPNRLAKDEAVSKGNYARFVAEPFEAGYGHTLGNSLRRVLISSLEGAAISSIKLEGAVREFGTLPGVKEDVTDIVLNLKKILFKLPNRDPHVLLLNVTKEGPITAGDIKLDPGIEVLNPDQIIATLDKKQHFEAELEVKVGRGYASAEFNKSPNQSIGVIAIDSLFSPVRKVKYSVENTRVGQRTDYDKLILEVWTDGRLTPDEALLRASAILRRHLDLFVDFDKETIEFEESQPQVSQENSKLKKLLKMSVNEIELSVRAANCLNNANITTVGQLAMKSEAEMLKYRNFGKKSLNEIKDKLHNLGLSLGMKLEPDLVEIPSSNPL